MKYQFYEVVKVVSNTPDTVEIDDMLGVVVGLSNDGNEDEVFSILITTTEEVWSVSSNELEATGKVFTKQQYENRDYLKLTLKN